MFKVESKQNNQKRVTRRLAKIYYQLPTLLPTPLTVSTKPHFRNRILVRRCGGMMTSSKSSKQHLFVIGVDPRISIEASPEQSNLAVMTVQL
jgi:hypothetical protein